MNVKPMKEMRPACYQNQKMEKIGKRMAFYRVKIFSSIKEMKKNIS